MPEAKHFFEFGPFRLDPAERLLLRDSKAVPLTPKAFDVLLLLVENSGHLLSKDELMKHVWPETFVEEVNLAQNISAIRRALDDKNGEVQYIETVPKGGYRFRATVTSHGATSPQTPIETAPPRPRKILVPAALLVTAAVLLGGLFLRSLQARRLTEKDTIVLADFVNTTGDPVFDDTLTQGLRVQLEQSPFLNILSDQKVDDELRLMGLSTDQRLSPELARDLCQREASKAVLQGVISNMGAHYVIGLKALNCQTGDTLATEQEEVDSRERVLKALSQSATRMRAKLGESLATIQKYDAPLEKATTRSLRALQAYSLAMKIWRVKGEADALPFFKQAIEQDPDFALAYADLADAYENLGEPDLAAESASKAYQLRDRVTEREKFDVSIVYYLEQTGELRKAMQTAQLWAQSYPRESLAHQYQSVSSEFLGDYEKAVTEGLEALRLDPDGRNLYSNLMEDYLALNRIEEAKTVYRRALERKLDNAFLHDDMYVLAFLEGDKPEMERQAAWAMGKPGAEDMLISSQADTEAYFGRSGMANRLSRRAVELAAKNNQEETAALWQLDSALQEAEFGNSSRARQGAQEGLARASTRDVQILAALTLARAGDSAQSQALAEALQKRFPSNIELNDYWLPCVQAAIQLNLRNPAKALEILEVAKPYDLAFPRPQAAGGGPLYPVWLRGLAFLLLHRGKEAAAEFRKILDHSTVITNSPVSSLSHLQLARAYAMQDDISKAQSAYETFLTLWRDADPDLPILRQAKTEYAKLKLTVLH